MPVRPSINVSLDADLNRYLQRFKEETGFNTSQAVRFLLTKALDASPDTGEIGRIYKECLARLLNKAQGAFAAMKVEDLLR